MVATPDRGHSWRGNQRGYGQLRFDPAPRGAARHGLGDPAPTACPPGSWIPAARPGTGETGPPNHPSVGVRRMAFDTSSNGVVILFGGMPNGTATDETWSYSVTGRGNGTGCTPRLPVYAPRATAWTACAVGRPRVEGRCQSCNVPGKAGACVLAAAGTQVPGSCSGDQACDGTGACKTANGGAARAPPRARADSAPTGCAATAPAPGLRFVQAAGNVRYLQPVPIGTDPEGDCSKGTPPCQSTCDGVGACVFPAGVSCGSCGTCSYDGSCVESVYCTVPNTNTRTTSSTGTATAARPLPPGLSPEPARSLPAP